jgi:peptidyl-tRNA hydrolase, PTH1 family
VTGVALKLVVGLGNPGGKYARTRHNAGWWFVEALARRHGAEFRADPRHQGEVASFMNKSGGAVASLAHFHRITPAEMLIAHDDLDLPPGIARFKLGGGHGGHNGLRDTSLTMGPDYWRLRLGIGHPGHKDLVVDYVLQRAAIEDEGAIEAAVDRSLDALPVLLVEGAEKAMNRLHTKD